RPTRKHAARRSRGVRDCGGSSADMRLPTLHSDELIDAGIPEPSATAPFKAVPTALLLISDLEFGGAQRQVIELANNMDPARFDIHVCCFSHYVPLASMLRDPESRLHVIPKRHKFDFGVVPKLV